MADEDKSLKILASLLVWPLNSDLAMAADAGGVCFDDSSQSLIGEIFPMDCCSWSTNRFPKLPESREFPTRLEAAFHVDVTIEMC